jgi:hypothetical protein
MLGRKERDQLELYMCGSLRDLVPDDHILVKVDRVLDLSWLHNETRSAIPFVEPEGLPGDPRPYTERTASFGIEAACRHE